VNRGKFHVTRAFLRFVHPWSPKETLVTILFPEGIQSRTEKSLLSYPLGSAALINRHYRHVLEP